MATKYSFRKVAAIILGLLALVVPSAAQFAPTAQARAAAADPAMEAVWARTDLPVEQGRAARTWMWGPEPFFNTYEPYAQGVGGQHLVSYYDKARMEINNPAGDRNSQWFVTNGLIVVEMISGRVQVGDNQFNQTSPANVVVAGDANSPNAPTYATLAGVASVGADRRAGDRTGQQIREGLGRAGNIGSADSLAQYAKYGAYEPTLGHNIADVFWNFLNQQALVYQNGTYQNGQLVDWLFAMGYPISEPYWIQINAGGQDRWVLMQAFQRRVLTYSPFNPEGWKVEMANVGRAYYNWRYATQAPTPLPAQPTPTNVPTTQASLAINPTQGDTNTTINLNGAGFPANSNVLISIENRDRGYHRDMKNTGTGGDGKFSTVLILPGEVASFGQVDIIASASNGARAVQTFRLNFNTRISVASGSQVANGSNLRVTGSGFPPGAGIDVGIFYGGNSESLSGTRADSRGNFDTSIYIGGRNPGFQFGVYATSGNFKATTSSNAFTVVNNATLTVSPSSGPANTNVTLQGRNWAAFRQIKVGLYSPGRAITWTGTVNSDGAGNFTATVFVGNEFANSDVRLVAYDQAANLQLEARYATNSQPAGPSISVNPTTLLAGQVGTAYGRNFPANMPVSVGIGRTALEEWVVNTSTDGAGNFTAVFTLSERWRNAGWVHVYGIAQNGAGAQTDLFTGNAPGVITPSGLQMQVASFTAGNQTTIKAIAAGWARGQAVNVDVFSADGAINQRVGSGTVRDDGTFQFAFKATAPWFGRTDLGLRATLSNGQQSVRYLPLTSASRLNGNAFAVSGRNWARNSRFIISVLHDGGGQNNVGDGATDANGNFNLNPVNANFRTGDTLRISTPDGQYIADFSY